MFQNHDGNYSIIVYCFALIIWYTAVYKELNYDLQSTFLHKAQTYLWQHLSITAILSSNIEMQCKIVYHVHQELLRKRKVRAVLMAIYGCNNKTHFPWSDYIRFVWTWITVLACLFHFIPPQILSSKQLRSVLLQSSKGSQCSRITSFQYSVSKLRHGYTVA